MIIALHVFLTIIPLVIMLLAINRRDPKRSLFIIYTLLAVFLFDLGYLVEVAAGSMEISIVGKQLKYIGLPFIAPLVFLFVLDYYDLYKISKLKAAILLAIPALHCIMAVTFPLNGVYYTSLEWISDTAVPHLVAGESVFYIIGLIYAFILSLGTLIIAISRYAKGSSLVRRQSSFIIASAAVAGIGNMIKVLAPLHLPFDPASLLITIGCTLLGWSFLRLYLLQIAPIAREHIIENMQDAFILIDQNRSYVDANVAAKKLFPQLAEAKVGTPIDGIQDIPWSSDYANMDKWTFNMPDDKGETHHYSISKTEIINRNEIICDCLMIFDVTESEKLLDELSKLAERDTLTGLINRRTFFNKGEWLFQEIASSGGNMSVLMMDLDYFKVVNDTYGHQVGDKVLTIIAQKLFERLRSTDLFTRYGGEEFCALLPRTDESDAMYIAKQLCEITEHIDWGGEMPNLRVTISIGVAVYKAGLHNSLDSLIGSADTALYAAKDSGRNIVCNYHSNINDDQIRFFT